MEALIDRKNTHDQKRATGNSGLGISNFGRERELKFLTYYQNTGSESTLSHFCLTTFRREREQK